MKKMNWEELLCVEVTPLPGVVVIFGATGDLAQRKLFPALANLAKRGLLHEDSMILACGRQPWSDEAFREHLGGDRKFLRRVFYLEGDNAQDAIYDQLAGRLRQIDATRQDFDFNHLFYMALGAEDALAVIRALERHGLLAETRDGAWRHVVLEKPFGYDYDSAERLNGELHAMLAENQIYRIDHYLGKETVQNILMLRFANVIFEPLWRAEYIDRVEITAAEELGVEQRGRYYDRAGALRDMFQNHMLQLLSLMAMEPPVSFDADAVRDEKAKLLRSIRPFDLKRLDEQLARAQYVAGDGLPGYRGEKGIAPDSMTETFVAAKLMIDNWRWKGVPFYLRSGKRLATKKSEIAIIFKRIPHSIFQNIMPEDLCADTLVLQIHPTEGAELALQAKKPGPKLCLGRMTLHFNYNELAPRHGDDAYERLLLDALLGDPSLFIRSDFIEESWKLLTPVLEAWNRQCTHCALEFYPARSEGPAGAARLIAPEFWRPLA